MPINDFNDVTEKTNDEYYNVSHVNDLRTAGINLGLYGGLEKKYSFSYTDFQTAALTNEINLYELTAKERVLGALIKHSTAFAGSGITALTLSVGTTGLPTDQIIPFDVLQAVGDTAYADGGYPKIYSFSSTTQLIIKATAVGANLDQLSQGAVDVWLLKRTLP